MVWSWGPIGNSTNRFDWTKYLQPDPSPLGGIFCHWLTLRGISQPFFSQNQGNTMFKTIRSILFLGMLTLVSIGCGSTNTGVSARVHGTVTYNGSVLPGGVLVYYSKTGGVFSSAIRKDGSYDISDAPVGDYEVTIETESINPNKKQEDYKGMTGGGATSKTGSSKYGKGGGSSTPQSKPSGGTNKMAASSSPMPDYAPQANAEYVKIPSRYGEKDKSGLAAKLDSGNQKVNFDLKD
jgi:hypothetical protein